jgi:hypothetical protein
VSLAAIFSVSSIYMALVGLGFLVAPDGILFGTAGTNPSPALLADLRGVAGAFIGIAVLNWLARGAEPSTARNAIVAANTVGFAIAGVAGVAAVLVASAPTVQLALGIINLVFAAAFAWVGRASMAAGPGDAPFA